MNPALPTLPSQSWTPAAVIQSSSDRQLGWQQSSSESHSLCGLQAGETLTPRGCRVGYWRLHRVLAATTPPFAPPSSHALCYYYHLPIVPGGGGIRESAYFVCNAHAHTYMWEDCQATQTGRQTGTSPPADHRASADALVHACGTVHAQLVRWRLLAPSHDLPVWSQHASTAFRTAQPPITHACRILSDSNVAFRLINLTWVGRGPVADSIVACLVGCYLPLQGGLASR